MAAKKTATSRPMDPANLINWSKMEPDKAAGRVDQMVQGHERTISWRHAMALRGAAAYSGAGLGDLFQNLSPYDGPNNQGKRRGRKNYAYGGWGTKVCERWARAQAETLTEKLMGLRMTKSQLVGTDLPYEKRRQGIWADRFNEGNMHLRQEPFTDLWDLCRHGFLVAAVSTGTVACRTEPDFVSKRVRSELRSTLQTFIDPGDVAHGRPLSYFDITWENPEYMCEDERWKGKEDLIMAASVVPPHQAAGNYDGASFGTRMVKKVTAWRMPFGSFAGREAVFVGGGSGEGSSRPKAAKQLFWGDWEFPEPPLAFFHINRCLGETFWSENWIEVMLDPLNDAEDIDDIAKNTMSRTSQTHMLIDGKTGSPAAFLNAKDVTVHRFSSKRGEQPPSILKPEILHEQYMQWRDRKIAIAKELGGVPDMASTSTSPSGTDSGRAKRLEASLFPERFARRLRAWDDWIAIGITKNQIRAAKRIGKVVPDWQVRWPGTDFEAKVTVKVLDIDLATYELRPYAVSEQKNTPSDRAEYAQEMYDKKQISGDQLSLILDGLYDTPKETEQVAAQRKYVAKVCDDMLHADEKVVADENSYMAERYEPPMPWTDPAQAMAQVLPVYYQAVIDGVPQNRRDLLKRFIEDILALKMQNDREQAMAQAKVSVAATPQQAFQSPGGGSPVAMPPMPAPQVPPPAAAPAPAPVGIPGMGGGGPLPNVAGAPGQA